MNENGTNNRHDYRRIASKATKTTQIGGRGKCRIIAKSSCTLYTTGCVYGFSLSEPKELAFRWCRRLISLMDYLLGIEEDGY